MMRTLNILAIATLIGSATAAYSVKYETILVAEKLKKRQHEMQREKDAIAVLQAEWQILNRPTRLQGLAPPEPGMQPLSARQIVRAQDIPQRGAEVDPLDSMLTGSVDAKSSPKPAVPKPTTTPVKVQGKPATTPSTASRPGAPKAATTPKVTTTPKPAMPPQKNASAAPRAASGAPLALRPPAPMGTTRGSAPRAEALAAPVPRRNVTPTPR